MTKRKKVKERMEITEVRSLLGNTCKEEKTMKSHGGEEELNTEIQKGGQMMHVKRDDSSSKPSSPDGKDLKEEDQLQTAKARVGKVREENERLKLLLAQMVREYQSLQMHFFEILQQEEAKKSTDRSPTREETEESELVSLSLGRISSEPKKDETNGNLINGKQDKIFNEGLAVGLDCRFVSNSTETENKPSSESSFEELMKEEEPTEMWPPSKILKTVRSGDEEDLKQTNLKKARVSVRARCDTPTMNDGCQWRKYGQKIAKGNPCPRAYYRCTVSPACPVRKQVQRWMEDMSILVTTYEGTHDHPLPFSAKAMASTTSAAASMLQCRSSTSVSTLNSTSTVANLHGSNFSFSQNATPFQLYFPNSSIFTNNSHPTVVLDLTAPSAFSHFNRLSSAPRYSSMCLNFANPSSTNFIEPDTRQTSWSSAYSNYGTPLYNKDPVRSLGLERQPPQEHIYQPYSLINNHLTPPHQSLKETTIATTTEDITSNPNFQSALAAAITSYIGNEGRKAHQNQSGGDNSGLNLSWNESFPVTTAKNGIGCTSSMFLNKLLTSTSQQEGKGSMSTFPPPLPFSKSKSASGSPADHTENHFK